MPPLASDLEVASATAFADAPAFRYTFLSSNLASALAWAFA